MSDKCDNNNHWGYNPFGENKIPTKSDINKYKLYKNVCGYWVSLLPK